MGLGIWSLNLTVSLEEVDTVAPWCIGTGLNTAVKSPLLVGRGPEILGAVVGGAACGRPAGHLVTGAAGLHDGATDLRAKRIWR